MRLSIGMIVMLSEGGKKTYLHSIDNPHDEQGVITSYDIHRPYSYEVKWNRRYNVYREDDLIPAINLSEKVLEDYL